MDAGNMLKPMLARGELHLIGATTLDEYRKRIEKDAALERRFQPVLVDEPSVEDAISILRGLRERLEVFHGVKIADSALVAAVTLSHRYISDRFLPDKAIDLVDEACAMLRTEIDSMPAELDELTRRVMRLEIEEAALAKETDPASKARLEELRQGTGRPAGRGRRAAGPVGGRAAGAAQGAGAARGAGAAAPGGRAGRARLRPQPGRGAAAGQDPGPRAAAGRPRRSSWPAKQGGCAAAAGGGHRATRSPRSSPRWTGIPVSPAAGGRAGEAAAAGRDPARAGDRPGRGRAAGRRRHHPGPFGDQGPAPADRVVHLPRPHRRRQDRAGQDAGRGAVRHRGQHGPDRHERVPGAAHGQPPGRRAARLRRLRGGRAADRGGPAQAVLGRAVRRDREGAPGRVQHAAAGPGRRPAHRRAGPHRRLPQHGHHHDLQHRLGVPAGRA